MSWFGFGRREPASPVATLVLAPLFAAGAVYLAVQTVGDAVAARSWLPAEARLAEVRFDTSRDTGGLLSVQYKYTVPGESAPRTGDRVDATRFPVDFFGSEGRLYASLRTELRSGMARVCYYDPADPSRAVLSRDMPYHVIGFALLALVLCTKATATAVRQIRTARRNVAQSIRDANTPYHPKEEWTAEIERRGQTWRER